MNVYVIGKYEEKEVVRNAMGLLTQSGHKITHDWTLDDASGMEGETLSRYLNECAEKCVNGVIACDVVLFLVHPKCQGAHTEVGMAIAYGRPVYLVNHELSTNIFFNMPDNCLKFASLGEAVDFINKVENEPME